MSTITRPRLRHAAVAAVVLLLQACGNGGPPEFPPPEVSVAAVTQKAVTAWDDYTGHIEAVDDVRIRSRVAGHLEAVHYREGGMVAKGALLFTIDAREYRAAAAAARGDLARAEARLALGRQEMARAEALIEARAVSQGELETRRGELLQAEADVLAARARLDEAELHLSFTRVTSPIAGRAGDARVDPGNLVSTGDLLTTVVSIDPVEVAFTGDERAYLRYQELARSGNRPSSRDEPNPVLVGLADEEGYPHRGTMKFIDNAIDPGSGTIRAQAILPNPDGLLTPGLFARVRLLGSTTMDALLIHDQAVLTDQDRRYVYVLGEGNTAQRRDVKLGAPIEGLRIVESGLAAGDKVIVNGVRKIFFPGQPVTPRDVPMNQPDQPAPPPAPAAG